MLLEIARDETEEMKWRMGAMHMLLDRGFGKPMQPIELNASLQADVKVEHAFDPAMLRAMTCEQRQALRTAAEIMRGMREPKRYPTPTPILDVCSTEDDE